MLAALARWGLRALGAPPDDLETPPGWLEKALRTTVVAYAPDSRIGFDVSGEQASLDRGTVVPGLIDDADAVVTGTPADLYALLVEGDTGAAEVDGDFRRGRAP